MFRNCINADRNDFAAALRAGVLATALTSLGLPALASDDQPSPAFGGRASQEANRMADRGAAREVVYANANKPGPQIIVLPGDMKSANATFAQKFGANNIADFAELELSRANFNVLERSQIEPLLREMQLAYGLGDPDQARKIMGKGKLKSTRWIVKMDVLRAEPIAEAETGFDGKAVSNVLSFFTRTAGAAAANTAVGTAKSGESAKVWLVGMRWRVIDAATTEQVATGYVEEKGELGSTSGSFMGVSSKQQGGYTMDGIAARLVQKAVATIDANHK